MKNLKLAILVIGFMFTGCSTLGKRENNEINPDQTIERVGYSDLLSLYSGDVRSIYKSVSI